jgi:hypothetical protein
MKGMLYLAGREEPVAVLDDVKVISFNDNHTVAPLRIFYKTLAMNATRVMLELQRDERMLIKLDDGRSAGVLLQHESMDDEGYSVGVLRVLGPLVDPVNVVTAEVLAIDAVAADAVVADVVAADTMAADTMAADTVAPTQAQ